MLKKILGRILMIAGIVLAGGGGVGLLCLIVFILCKWDDYAPLFLLLVFVFGGTLFSVGVGLFFAGRAFIRAAQKTQTNASPDPAARKLEGSIMLAAGILIAGASGVCSLVIGGSVFFSGGEPSSPGFVLIFGGPPFLIGMGLLFAGRALIRSAREKES